jgi:hypothetical protein
MLSQRRVTKSGRAEQKMASPSLELRPKWFHQYTVLLGIPLFGAFIGLSLADHDVIVAIVFVVILVGGAYVSYAKVRITVTPDEVVVSDTFGPGRRGRVPRSAVTAIHIYSFYVVLDNRAGPNLSSNPYWTRSQLLDLSEVLGVPLINHRRLGGWGRDTPGTVVMRTTRPGQPPGEEQRTGEGQPADHEQPS